MKIPETHPRYRSLNERHVLVEGMKKGYVAEAGLIAHGRGEAFDYMLGEKTITEAEKAEKVATGILLLAQNPVISVNGNAAALVPREIIELAKLTNSKIEVNLFHRTERRVKLIKEILKKSGAKKVLGTGPEYKLIPGIDSKRSKVDPEGIWKSGCVLVPLEDGDRTKGLVDMDKKVLAIDLNPLSRTSQTATITIVDNVTRAIPNMIEFSKEMKDWNKNKLDKLVSEFDNKENVKKIVKKIRKEL